MEKRIRSPNYPAISLPEAVARVTAMYKALHTHPAPREVAVRGMGFNTLNGASATVISALHKYGLLDKAGEGVKVSERALTIMHPHSSDERRQAVQASAREPELFAELADRFPGPMPNEDLLKNYLVRKGFAPGALASVITAYRETLEMVEREASGYDSAPVAGPTPETPRMPPTQYLSPPLVHSSQNIVLPQEDGRQIGRYDFEDGGFVRIIASPDLDTEEALAMVETIIDLKRKELAARKKRTSEVPKDADEPWSDKDE